MSSALPMLERALVWDEAGHLAEAAVAALVDGELALLPPDAVAHADGCPECADRIGRAALFALEVSEALSPSLTLAIAHEAEPESAPGHALALVPGTALARAEPAPLLGSRAEELRAPTSSRPPYARASSSLAPPPPLPVKAVVAALLVALVAGGPWLWTVRPDSLAEGLGHVARLLTQTIEAVRAPAVPALAWAAAGVFALIGAVAPRIAARLHARRMVEGTR